MKTTTRVLLVALAAGFVATSPAFAQEQPVEIDAGIKLRIEKLCPKSITFNLNTRELLGAELDCSTPGLSGVVTLSDDPREKVIDAIGHIVDQKVDKATVWTLRKLQKHGWTITGATAAK